MQDEWIVERIVVYLFTKPEINLKYKWSNRVVQKFIRPNWRLKGQTIRRRVDMIVTPTDPDLDPEPEKLCEHRPG